jgi:hypothetical protein
VPFSAVDEAFTRVPGAWQTGAVPWTLVEAEYGPDAVVGGPWIRERLRREYGYRAAPIGPRRAKQLLEGYQYDEWRGLQVTRSGSLQAWAVAKGAEKAAGIAKRTGYTDPRAGGGSRAKG